MENIVPSVGKAALWTLLILSQQKATRSHSLDLNNIGPAATFFFACLFSSFSLFIVIKILFNNNAEPQIEIKRNENRFTKR